MTLRALHQKVWSESTRPFLFDLFRAYWILVKIMVPVLFLVKLLEYLGATDLLAQVLAPLMSLIGLPAEFGLVWAVSLLTNIYTAMVVFYEIGLGQGYSVAEISTLGILILLGHAIPVEGAVSRMMHVSWGITILTRVLGAYILAGLTMLSYHVFDIGQQQASLLWKPEAQVDGLLNWGFAQLEMLAMIFLILASLMLFMRFLRVIHFERLLTWLLQPLTRALDVGKEAANVTIIGLMLGLSFGAGLLVAESRKGHISKRDIVVVVCFLGVCHSVIEDTLLIMLLGADIIPILLGRLVFSVLMVAFLARTFYARQPTFD